MTKIFFFFTVALVDLALCLYMLPDQNAALWAAVITLILSFLFNKINKNVAIMIFSQAIIFAIVYFICFMQWATIATSMVH